MSSTQGSEGHSVTQSHESETTLPSMHWACHRICMTKHPLLLMGNNAKHADVYRVA